eukprot:scaffold11670_cov136-Isochrysis_galbana.AAC.5
MAAGRSAPAWWKEASRGPVQEGRGPSEGHGAVGVRPRRDKGVGARESVVGREVVGVEGGKAVAAGVKGGGTEDGVEGGEGATRKCAVGEGTVEEGLGGLDKARGVGKGKGGDCGARAEAEAVQAGGEANAGADERIVIGSSRHPG